MMQTALLIVDMQLGMSSLTCGERNNPDAEQVILSLLTHWRKTCSPIVHIRHISRTPSSPFWPGQKGVEFQPLLSPLASEHVVDKNVPDAFIHSSLERWLRVRDVRSLLVVGVSTNNSVEATARTAGNLGFQTYVASDATFTFAKKDYSGVQRSAEEVHAMALSNLNGEYATVITSQEAINAF